MNRIFFLIFTSFFSITILNAAENDFVIEDGNTSLYYLNDSLIRNNIVPTSIPITKYPFNQLYLNIGEENRIRTTPEYKLLKEYLVKGNIHIADEILNNYHRTLMVKLNNASSNILLGNKFMIKSISKRRSSTNNDLKKGLSRNIQRLSNDVEKNVNEGILTLNMYNGLYLNWLFDKPVLMNEYKVKKGGFYLILSEYKRLRNQILD